MLFVVQFNRDNEQFIIDHLPFGPIHYKTFLSGTLNEICGELGKGCYPCGKTMKQDDYTTLYMLFSLKDSSKTFELLCSLASTKLVDVKNFDNVEEFFRKTQTICQECRRKVKTEVSDISEQSEPVVQQFVPVFKVESVQHHHSDTQTVQPVVILEETSQPEFMATTPASLADLETTIESVTSITTTSLVHAGNTPTTELDENCTPRVKKITEPIMTRKRTLDEISKKNKLGVACKKCQRTIGIGFTNNTRGIQWSMESHIRQHSANFPYQCNMCDYKARQLGSINIHRKRNNSHKTFTDTTQTDEYKVELAQLMKECFPNHKWIESSAKEC